ncbi:MAG: AAA family ATPase [Candidatus Latescibacterota bacterium]
MNEDYLAYWGMTKPPFSLTPDPEMLYLSAQHAECLMRLKYAIFSHKGGALLVSDNAGNGKTSVLARLKKELTEYYSGRVRVVFIDHPTLSPIEMIGEISRQLGGELNTTEKIRSLNSLRDRLFAFYNENVKVVVIVDEGQMLKERPDILQELRILLNFCVSEAFLLTFIFSGQKPLDGILRNMPEFWQRLPVRFFLKNLDFNDTRSLIQFRLRKVGVTEEIFTADAYEGIYHYSEGCPRIICSAADICLLIGYSKRVRRIGFVEVSAACRDMESTGDSFHYFTYIRNQEDTLRKVAPDQPPTTGPQGLRPPPEPEPEPNAASPGRIFPKPPPGTVIKPLPADGATSCPRCSEPNSPGEKFCRKCGAPLQIKCPKCGAVSNTSSAECPGCNVDMEKEGRILTERLREKLIPFDVLERNYAVWLQASGVELDKDEKVIIVFPRGNLFSPGASLLKSAAQGKAEKKNCDFILTERRFHIRLDGELHTHDLARVETCMVSSIGKTIGKNYSLLLGVPKGIFTVQLPYRGEKGRKICEDLAGYIQKIMLK